MSFSSSFNVLFPFALACRFNCGFPYELKNEEKSVIQCEVKCVFSSLKVRLDRLTLHFASVNSFTCILLLLSSLLRLSHTLLPDLHQSAVKFTAKYVNDDEERRKKEKRNEERRL